MKNEINAIENSKRLLQNLDAELELLNLTNDKSRILKLKGQIKKSIYELEEIEHTVGWGLIKLRLLKLIGKEKGKK